MLTFLGSSYFRGLHEGAVYGSSARGLAIDIAMNKDEEFPAFRDFWVHRPHEDDDQLTILAHLDITISVAGYLLLQRKTRASLFLVLAVAGGSSGPGRTPANCCLSICESTAN